MAAVKRREDLHNLEQPIRKRKVVKRKVRKPKSRKSKLKSRLGLISSMILVVSLSLLLLSRYAEISRETYKLSDLDSQIYSAVLQKNELSVDMNKIKNSEALISQAHDKINLRPATEGQIVKVVVPSSLAESETSKNVILAKFEGAVEKLFKD